MLGIKRVIDGKSYNTDTSFQICAHSSRQGQRDREEHLYLTQEGGYFACSFVRARGTAGCSMDNMEDLSPLTTEEARKWLSNKGLDDEEGWFGKDDPKLPGQVMVTLRLPRQLADIVTAHALIRGRSRSSWINNAILAQLTKERAEAP